MDKKSTQTKPRKEIEAKVDQTFLVELAELAHLVERPALLGKFSLNELTSKPKCQQIIMVTKYGAPEDALDTVRVNVKNLIFDLIITRDLLFKKHQEFNKVEIENKQLRQLLESYGA